MAPDAPSRRPKYDIYIVGTGIGVRQITPEVAAVIRRSTEVFYVDTAPGIDVYLSQLCPKVTNLDPEYHEGADRGETYRRMSARVFSAAIDHPPVTLALYGHPLVFALPPFQLMYLARTFGLAVKVLPGISSLDTMLVDLSIDPAVHGLQVYEATDLVSRQRPLQPDVSCFLLQIGTFGLAAHSTKPRPPERFAALKEHLLQFYPPTHHVKIVASAVHPLMQPVIVEFELQVLDQRIAEQVGDTLFIPPVSTRPFASSEWLTAVLDQGLGPADVESPA